MVEFFRRYWRSDRLFPVAIAGVVLALYGFQRIESSPGQKFSLFLEINRPPLLWFAAGALLFMIGCSGRAAGQRMGGFTLGASPPAPRMSRWKKWLRRLAGLCVLGGAVAAFYYVIWDISADGRIPLTSSDPYKAWVGHPAGLDGPVALVLGGLLLVVGLALMECRRRSWFVDLGFGRHQRGLRFWRRDAPWLWLFMLLWFGVNALHLETRPGYFTLDEANVIYQGKLAFNPAGPPGGKLNAPWENLWEPYGSCILRALVREMFPDHRVLGSRLPSVFMGALVLVLVFVLARSQFGRLPAWITLVLAASNHVLISFSRRGYTSMDAVALVALALLAFLAGWRSRRLSMGALAGFLAGGSFYTYSAALVSLPLFTAPLLIFLVRDPRYLLRRWGFLAAFGIALAVAATPNQLFFKTVKDANWYRNRMFMLSRDMVESSFRHSEATNVPEILLNYSWPAVGGILLWPRAGMDYDHASNKKEILDREAAAVICLGVLASLLLWRRRFAFLMVSLWWWFIVIFGSLLTLGAPYSARIIGFQYAGFVLAGWVVGGLVDRGRRLGGWWLGAPLLFAAMGWTAHIAGANLRHFYWEHAADTTNPGYDGLNMGFTEFFNRFPPDAQLFLWTPAGSWETFESIAFQIYDTGFPKQQFHDADAEIPDPVPGRRNAYMVSLRDFASVDARLKARFPDVTPEELRNPFRPQNPPTHHIYWIGKDYKTSHPAPASESAPSDVPLETPILEAAPASLDDMLTTDTRPAEDAPTSGVLESFDVAPTSGTLTR